MDEKPVLEDDEVFVVIECSLPTEEYLSVTKDFDKAVKICRRRLESRGIQPNLDYKWRRNSESLKFIGYWMIYFIIKEKLA